VANLLFGGANLTQIEIVQLELLYLQIRIRQLKLFYLQIRIRQLKLSYLQIRIRQLKLSYLQIRIRQFMTTCRSIFGEQCDLSPRAKASALEELIRRYGLESAHIPENCEGNHYIIPQVHLRRQSDTNLDVRVIITTWEFTWVPLLGWTVRKIVANGS
jgi:hypothetical protein